ncbi:uncharacterized protein TMBIM7P isoform X3 [Gorilla gorilla gorilla]|uniref:uncharacterized protein TMBIM7P isoform X3 n=1 Tax=Gorilla gorilla gorilla TaxID=9595 RepID=UPI002445A8AC|nr:uncharacterized protein TMBIM7P isoform X3 [Gorilla gorilla gorilla]
MKLDLEVSEPIDFGSGGHQYLIWEAADKSIQSQSGERYTPSSSAGPQETREKPRPKDTKQSNTCVIEISDDVTPGDNNATLGNPFSDASVRRAFIIKVFFLLSVQLLLTAVITSVFIFWEALKVWVLKNPWFIYAIFSAFFAILIILDCCGNLRRQVPANYILLGFFSLPITHTVTHLHTQHTVTHTPHPLMPFTPHTPLTPHTHTQSHTHHTFTHTTHSTYTHSHTHTTHLHTLLIPHTHAHSHTYTYYTDTQAHTPHTPHSNSHIHHPHHTHAHLLHVLLELEK